MGQAMLERLGYQVTVRTSSLEALATFQNDPHRFDAVITDQTMPGMTGLDLARRMLQIRPELPIILCTGYSNLVNETQAKAYGIKGFAMKPLTKTSIRIIMEKSGRTKKWPAFSVDYARQYPYLIPQVESLDSKHFPSSSYLAFLHDYLTRKYQDQTFDLVIALDNPALDLVVNPAYRLFPGVPVVFAGINGYRPDMKAGRTKVTGVMEQQDAAGTLALALSLQPKISKVLAVHDYTASGLAVRQEAEAALAPFAGALDITYTADVPFETLSETLKAMPKNSLVLLLTYVTDTTGRTFTREESTRLITSLSPAPVYAMHETRLGFGIMGGLLLEGHEHGWQAGGLALQILAGADPDDMPVEVSRSRSILDYTALQRFEIPGHLWPADAVIINRPESFWVRHRTVLIPALSAIGVMVVLTSMLIAAVLRQRRTAEALCQSEEKYRVLFNIFPLGLTLTDRLGNIVETNETAARLLGVPRDEHLARSLMSKRWSIIRPDGTPYAAGGTTPPCGLYEKTAR
jgi:CheY-like chemotaxis protein